IDRLRDALQQRIDAGRLPGAVMLILRRGALGCFEALGRQDPARDLPMRRDSIFRIYSMTKPIVSVAAMRLFEQGRLLLDDPVAKYLPEFADVKVGIERNGALELVAPRRPMTVHDLLRHTSGLTYEFLPPSAVRRRYSDAKVWSLERDNAEASRQLAQLPLMHQPGSAWEYSRSTDVLGRLVEVLAGQTLGEHLRETLFTPLGMPDTGFDVPAAQHGRIAEPFAVDPDSGAAVQLSQIRRPMPRQSGGGGLVSTAVDYARFLQLMLHMGTWNGQRILGHKTVEYMTCDHLGAIPVTGDLLEPGHGFGLGFAVRLVNGVAPIPGSAGVYSWGGIAGTSFFVDPREALFAVLLVQAPGQRVELGALFRNLVYAALER
ncbi:MAG TPA: serine hydrolase domain-containing protein, partial [Albitalea sp.]|nr:serine hydrolase domain-containing protein [Albitalea sp.]